VEARRGILWKKIGVWRLGVGVRRMYDQGIFPYVLKNKTGAAY
jgi:hypothetical protein